MNNMHPFILAADFYPDSLTILKSSHKSRSISDTEVPCDNSLQIFIESLNHVRISPSLLRGRSHSSEERSFQINYQNLGQGKCIISFLVQIIFLLLVALTLLRLASDLVLMFTIPFFLGVDIVLGPGSFLFLCLFFFNIFFP